MNTSYDLVILGGGSGGYVAAIRAAQLGKSVVVIEEAKVGGTCLHRGCIPTKALLQSAFFLDMMHTAPSFGITATDIAFDYSTAEKKRDSIVSQLHKGIGYLLKKNGVTVISGRGVFVNAHTIRVGDQTVSGSDVIIATGSAPSVPNGISIDEHHIMTSDEALFLDHIPSSATILGAGAVGVEFASLYRSWGVDVHLVEMAPHLVPLEDVAIGKELEKRFSERGIHCHVGATLDVSSVALNENAVAVTFATGEKTETLETEVLLIAVGRRPLSFDIGLEHTGVVTVRGFITTNEWCETSVPHIYAVGDVVGGFQLAHKAMHEGVVAAERLSGEVGYPLHDAEITRTTYCNPQIASVGMTETQAQDAGITVGIGIMPFRANGRALTWGEGNGFCKVVTDTALDRVIGVHMIGHEVTELIYGPGLGILVEASPYEFAKAVAPHPTLSEVLGEAALAASGKAIHV